MIICKICNPTLEGNGYCAEHSTNGTSYLENNKKTPMPKQTKEEKIIEILKSACNEFKEGECSCRAEYEDVVKYSDQILELFEEEKQKLAQKIEKLIVKEILIAQKEGQPTSRLTSLIMEIKHL